MIAKRRELTVFLCGFVLSTSLNLGNTSFNKQIFFKQKLGPELLTVFYFHRLNILSF